MNQIASLVFDSWTEPIPELRSPTREDRHLIYEGAGVVLDLLLKHGKDGTCLHLGGQVLPDDSQVNVSNLPVLIEHGKDRSLTQTNALGEFMFHAIPNGTVDIAVVLRNCRLMIRGLSHSEPRQWKIASTGNGGSV